MRSTALVLLFCAGLLMAACDEKPKPPGGPMPKASSIAVVPALSAA